MDPDDSFLEITDPNPRKYHFFFFKLFFYKNIYFSKKLSDLLFRRLIFVSIKRSSGGGDFVMD